MPFSRSPEPSRMEAPTIDPDILEARHQDAMRSAAVELRRTHVLTPESARRARAIVRASGRPG
jgi:hypothetical protein